MKIATFISLVVFLGIPVSSVLVSQVALASNTCNENNTVRLTANSPRVNFSGVLTAPGNGYQRYKVTCLDVTSFPQGGKLIINISLSDGISGGSFDLFPRNAPIPTQGHPDDSLVGAYDIPLLSLSQQKNDNEEDLYICMVYGIFSRRSPHHRFCGRILPTL